MQINSEFGHTDLCESEQKETHSRNIIFYFQSKCYKACGQNFCYLIKYRQIFNTKSWFS